jgi:hypothetical protein
MNPNALTEESYGPVSTALQSIDKNNAEAVDQPMKSASAVDRFRIAERVADRKKAQTMRNRSVMRISDHVQADLSLQASHVLQAMVDMVFADKVRRVGNDLVMRLDASRGMIAKHCRWCSHTEAEADETGDEAVVKATDAAVKRVARAMKQLESAGYLSRQQTRRIGWATSIIQIPVAAEYREPVDESEQTAKAASHATPKSLSQEGQNRPPTGQKCPADGTEMSQWWDKNVPLSPALPSPEDVSTTTTTNADADSRRRRVNERPVGGGGGGEVASLDAKNQTELENLRVLRLHRRDAFVAVLSESGPKPTISADALAEVENRRLKPSTIRTEAIRIRDEAKRNAVRNPVGMLRSSLRKMPDDMTPDEESTWIPPLATWGAVRSLLKETRLEIDGPVIVRAIAFARVPKNDRSAIAFADLFNRTHPQHPPIVISTTSVVGRGVCLKNASATFFGWVRDMLSCLRRDEARFESIIGDALTRERDVESEIGHLKNGRLHRAFARRMNSDWVDWIEATHSTYEQAIDDGFVSIGDAWNQNGKDNL